MTEIDTPSKFLEIVEKERVRQGVAVEALATRAGLSHAAYYYIRRQGTDRISLDTALRYARVLGLQLTCDVTKAARRRSAEKPDAA